MPRWTSDPNPSGLCWCGCGEKTTVVQRNNARIGMRKGWHNRFVGRHNTRGRHSPSWKGGRQIHTAGYVLVHAPDHPRASNGSVLEHLLVAEKALGRPIPRKHPVHHANEDRADNRPGTARIVPMRLSGRPGVLVKTPFSDAFLLQLKALVPYTDRWWNERAVGWWCAQPYQDVVEHIVRDVFGTYELEDEDGLVVTYTAAGEKLYQEELLP
jgi:hypothetical protein